TLYRTNAQSRAVEAIFLKATMAYQMVGRLKFYDRKEIKDIIANIRLITNPADIISFERIVNVVKRGIGVASIEKLRTYALMQDLSLFDAILEVEATNVPKRAVNALMNFRLMMDDFIKQQEFLSATDMVETVLEQTEYEEALKNEKSID